MPVGIQMTAPSTVACDASLRTSLLQYFVTNAMSTELADWLRNIGQDPKGTVEERRARVLANSKYPSMPAAEFPDQTLYYLEIYSRLEHLRGICEALGLSDIGNREMLWRRIMREVGIREGWLPKVAKEAESTITTSIVRPFVEWHLMPTQPEYERDFYPSFLADFEEIFGPNQVHEQLPIASGTTLKIDFHIGHPQRAGVGIEVKMPTSNSDLQRAMGQMEQYQACYADRLIVVLLPNRLNKAQVTLFQDKLSEKGITVIIKS